MSTGEHRYSVPWTTQWRLNDNFHRGDLSDVNWGSQQVINGCLINQNKAKDISCFLGIPNTALGGILTRY